MNYKNFRKEILKDYKPIGINELQQTLSKPKFSVLSFFLIPIITIGIYIVIFKYVIQSKGNFYLFFVVSASIGLVASSIRFITEYFVWRKKCKKIAISNKTYIDKLVAKSMDNAKQYKVGMLKCFPKLDGEINCNWIRSSAQKSFMKIRVGLGEARNPSFLYFQDENVKKSFESEFIDEVASTQLISGVPFLLDMKNHNIIGIFGGYKEEVFNSIIMNAIVFHSEDDLRVCTINDKNTFEWCKKISHANIDDEMNMYAENVEEIHRIIKKVYALAQSDDGRMNLLVLSSDMFLQIRQVREMAKLDNVLIVVLCEDSPMSCCDVVIGDDLVSFNDKVQELKVSVDKLPLSVSIKYVQNNRIVYNNSELKEEKNVLPEYIDAFTFFGIPEK